MELKILIGIMGSISGYIFVEVIEQEGDKNGCNNGGDNFNNWSYCSNMDFKTK